MKLSGKELGVEASVSGSYYQLSIVDLSVCATGVMFRKRSPVSINSRVFPTLSSNMLELQEFGNDPSPSIVWNTLRRIGISCTLNFW
ncbi:hypothetical protein H671_2g6189 [Cricetulus griseus]|uniref:Uncharacterized protein n=1 Tax=Cricetulus griseus TaxID=10029 RepID=A0A061IIC6_CRIGR|nr:hypothetical protein H671_2g6189 [Cricetulus griseus]